MRATSVHAGFFPVPDLQGCPPWRRGRRRPRVAITDNERATMTATSAMTASPTGTDRDPESNTPTERLLTGSLFVAPLVYLAADSTYAARGWDNGTAGVIHVLGAIAYGFVVLRVAGWLPRSSKLAAVILLTGLIGMAGKRRLRLRGHPHVAGRHPAGPPAGCGQPDQTAGPVLPDLVRHRGAGPRQARSPVAGSPRPGGNDRVAHRAHRQTSPPSPCPSTSPSWRPSAAWRGREVRP